MNPYIVPGLKFKGAMNRNLPAMHVIKTVAQYYQVDVQVMFKKTRKREHLMPRQISMYLLRQYTSLSLKSIGKMFQGNRPQQVDHTTVIHSCKVIDDLICTDSRIEGDINNIRQML